MRGNKIEEKETNYNNKVKINLGSKLEIKMKTLTIKLLTSKKRFKRK
jgi:hypothetical protein